MIPTKKLVMIPGPVPVSASVLSKLGSEVKAHTDPDFVAEFQELLAELRSITNCEGIAFLVAGSGTMGMEMAIANIANEKDKVLVCSNGHFGDRYISICKNRGLDMETIEAESGSYTPNSPDGQLQQTQVLGIIEEEIKLLPTRQREAFLMRYWEDMDVAETASAMGCSEGSVKTHCSRATNTLANALKARGITL